MTRTISGALAPVVEALELDQVALVDVDTLRAVADEARVDTPVHVIVQRLVARGWLLTTGVRGVYEFAPGAHAGPYGRGDPFMTLRAQLRVTPTLSARVCLASALWLHSLADRAPDSRHEVSLPPGAHPPVALTRRYRVVRFAPKVPAHPNHAVAVDRPATILVHLATKPADVSSWLPVMERLGDLTDAADPDEIGSELRGRGHAAAARLSYLLDASDDADLRRRFAVDPAGKVWFGPRGKLRRHDAARNLADTVLPVSPAEVRR